MSSSGVLNSQLSKKTGFFGLRLWVVIGIGVGVFIVLILFFLSVWLASRNKKSRNAYKKFPSSVSSTVASIPAVSKEIKEVPTAATEGVLLTILDKSAERNAEKVYVHVGFNRRTSSSSSIDGSTGAVVGVEMGKQLRKSRGEIEENNNSRNLQIVKTGIYNDNNTSSDGGYSGSTAGDTPRSSAAPEVVAHLGWGHWYTLRDLEDATQGFSPENVLGEGGYGIVYRGYLPDGTLVAVKSLLNNRGQAEKEFKVEVEAIGRVRHKNLVRLLGYCVEGNYRMLVYEYVDNGNLEQWLHGQASEMNSPAWEARIKIALGTSKALAYLHEALEPKVVHRDIKASNILLDAQWSAKISDFGLAKMLGSDNSHVKTRVMGTFGYVAPEYANTGLLNERSDVYSFGVLLMELITGRDPVDYGRPSGEVNLVDWVKLMVASRRSEEVADERIAVKPSGRAIKRVLLVALRCVDPDPLKRPKMGRVVHMLETDDFPYHHREGSGRELSGIVSKRTDYKQDRMVEELMSGDDHEETSQ